MDQRKRGSYLKAAQTAVKVGEWVCMCVCVSEKENESTDEVNYLFLYSPFASNENVN